MKLKALSMKKKPEFSIPNLPNYREFYDTFTELKNDTEVSTELTPTFNCNALVPFVSFQSLEFPKQIRASSGIFSHNQTPIIANYFVNHFNRAQIPDILSNC